MSSRSLSATANPPQHDAITTDGPLLLITRLGSGKTFTLVTLTPAPYPGAPL